MEIYRVGIEKVRKHSCCYPVYFGILTHNFGNFDRFNITVAGTSTDGDPRALSCMKNALHNMIASPHNEVLVDVKNEQEVSYIQDPIHEALKLRNFLLKPSRIIPMGNAQVSTSHLRILIKKFPKNMHGLVLSDISPDDRQNFKSYEKITTENVLQSLANGVVGSEATIKYLSLCKQITHEFTEPNLKPEQRIYFIWSALYFFRAWRKWIQRSDYSLGKNFISSNAFSCLEINAYGLLHLIVKFRDAGTPQYFLPVLFQSQTCENTFRQMRSMSAAYWTRINFSLLDLLYIIRRIELQNELAYSKLIKIGLSIPSYRHNLDSCEVVHELPSNEEIQNILKHARDTAISEASIFGMDIIDNDILHCKLRKTEIRNISTQVFLNDHDENMDQDPDISVVEESERFPCSSLKNYSSSNQDLSSQSDIDKRYLVLVDEDGRSRTVLKSSIVWLLTESKKKLSNDRLRRVQSSNPPTKKRTESFDLEKQLSKRAKANIYNADNVQIGDWCLFFKENDSNQNNRKIENVLIGSLLGFRNGNAKNEKDSEYSLECTPTKTEETSGNQKLLVNAVWFKVDNQKLVATSLYNSFHVDITHYIANVCHSIINKIEGKIGLSIEIEEIEKYITSYKN